MGCAPKVRPRDKVVTNWRLIESKNAKWGELKPHWRFLLVDSPPRNPKGCKESSRWSESAETTGNGILNWVAPRRGARTFAVAIFWVDLYRDLRNSAGVEFDENYLF